MFTKAHVHQDYFKSLDQLSFLEHLNSECDTRAKKLITNSSEDEVTPFPLEIKSVYVMNLEKHLIFNHASDVTIHTHLIRCEAHLKMS